MILVYYNQPFFEYDVHSLIKAFFPKDEVQMYYLFAGEEARENLACMHKETKSEEELPLKDASHLLRVHYDASGMELIWRMLEQGEEKKKVFAVDMEDKSAAKNALKQNLYELLCDICKKRLPWGSLTGIRPTKIPMKMLEEGASRQEIASYMKETYLASDEKINLSIDIAERERKLLSRIDYENGYSLYVGIPFCPSTCLYCSFTSYPLASWKGRVDSYLDALEREIDYTAEQFKDKKLNSVYIGGGTPTTLEPYQLDRLIGKIIASFPLEDCLEFTVEAGRPDSITREKLEVLRKHGISRISINPQTMKQETLDLIGRHHTVEQTIDSYRLARKMGFDNINMDLILGLPEEELSDVRNTMEVLKELHPDNVTIHSLAIKRAARLNIWKERYEKMQMVNTQEHMELCGRYCAQMGLYPYYLYRQKGMAGNMENVGYAAEGKAGVYNILIMEEKQTIVALGAGSVSKRVYPDGQITRCENVKDVKLYMEQIEEMIERKKKLFYGK